MKAYIYEDFSLEILVGSKFKYRNGQDVKEMLEDEIVKENGNYYEFITPFSFSSLKEATEFLTSEDVSEWELWEDSDEDPLNVKLRAFLVNKSQSKNK